MVFAVWVAMKKILSLAAIVGITGLVHATTINAPSSLIGSWVLDGGNAYSWGVTIPLTSGQTVTSAQIDFTSVTLVASGNAQGTGTLYTDLLNSKVTGVNGVTTATDGDAAGDYWATQFSGANIVGLGGKFFASVGTTLSWSYLLSSSQLTSLNTFLTANNGVFNIGIDPDCHWSVGNISFTYTLSSTNTQRVPDAAATAFLMLLGLAALEVCRRQFGVAAGKA